MCIKFIESWLVFHLKCNPIYQFTKRLNLRIGRFIRVKILEQSHVCLLLQSSIKFLNLHEVGDAMRNILLDLGYLLKKLLS